MSSNEPPADGPVDPHLPDPSAPSAPPPPPPPPPYGSPPAGGYGGYGTPPPPPGSPGGYGYGAPAPAARWNLGEALSYGWAKFQANAAQIIIAAVILVVALGVIGGIGIGIQAALTSADTCRFDASGNYDCSGGTGLIAGLFINAVLFAVLLVVAQVVGAGIIRGALGITEGRAFDFRDILRLEKVGPVLVASLLIAAATFVGTLLCYLPGVIIGFVTSYTLFFVIDKDLSPVDAIRASVTLVKDNLADTLVWYIVGGIIAAVGLAICLVGGLVSIPVVLIGTAYTYKRLTDQPVAA